MTQYETETDQPDADSTAVQVSPEARLALEKKVREWTGWPDAALVMGKPTASPFAQCEHDIRTITANPETLVLNPNRVLLTLTPFRLRQEAVLTGALLHEAAHARHTKWKPRTAAEMRPLIHGDGKPVTKQTLAFAKLMEEARIEGIMAREADTIGAAGLGWTMRAAAAHLVPTTSLSQFDDQQIMDLIQSWVLRAGRQVSLAVSSLNREKYTEGQKAYVAPNWVGDFTSLLTSAVEAHLAANGAMGAGSLTSKVMRTITAMVSAGQQADTGTEMVDDARVVLEILFPETDGDSDEAAMPSEVCQEDRTEDPEQDDTDSEPDEGDDEGESGDDESEDDSQEGAGEDESDEEGEGDSESDDESDEPGDGDGGSDSDEDSDDGDDGEPGASESEQSDLAKMLADLEAQAKGQVEDEAEDEAEQQPTAPGGNAAGLGNGDLGGLGQGWRNPSAEEREVQRGAEKFLRGIVAPTESSKIRLTEAPSATVDGAAMAAWKAAGQNRDPLFFRRVKREVQPSPPVQIAVLVDVSGSMDELQKPSALLSWALASAAFDLRNFAGRGAQVASTLIHWGSFDPRVIVKNGEMMPGLKEFPCNEGTHRMPDALALVEEQIPGFFDTPTTPVNRLLVQFTDWEMPAGPAVAPIKRALEAGVNMLSIVPTDYSPRYSALEDILPKCKVQRGASHMMKYNKMFPEQVWDEASRILG